VVIVIVTLSEAFGGNLNVIKCGCCLPQIGKAERLRIHYASVTRIQIGTGQSPDHTFKKTFIGREIKSKSTLTTMDPSYVDSENEAEAMAKQMGFSSFGTQGPSKKRKFNPKIDAMVEGQELASLDRGGKKGHGSGGNKIPLGKPRVLGVPPPLNQDELEIDIDGYEDQGPACIDTSLPPPSHQDDSDEEEGPAYIDTSRPPPNEEANAAQEKIDAILANNTVPPVPPDSRAKMKPPILSTGRGVAQFLASRQYGTQSSIPNVLDGRAGGSFRGSHQPRERGQRNEFWYVGYYDPSFNENPWAQLEEANGLEPRGTWVERGR
jgi:hypothetical protein